MGSKAQEPKLLIDACLTRALIEHLLHHRGIDAVRVDQVLAANADDDAVMKLAIAQDRAVVTENAEDFRRLGKVNPGHPGLIIVAAGVGKTRQIELATLAVDRMLADIGMGRNPAGHVYDVTAAGRVRRMRLPKKQYRRAAS